MSAAARIVCGWRVGAPSLREDLLSNLILTVRELVSINNKEERGRR
jgi:hypothetical protein